MFVLIKFYKLREHQHRETLHERPSPSSLKLLLYSKDSNCDREVCRYLMRFSPF